MALTLSLDLENITLNDLITFIQAVEAAGLNPTDAISLDGNQLIATVNTSQAASDSQTATPPLSSWEKYHRPHRENSNSVDVGEIIEDLRHGTNFNTIAPFVDPKTLGEAALNSLIEALKYRRGQ